MNEHGDLEQLAGRLGRTAAERLDVEATARAVVERLRQPEERERVARAGPEWLRVAAVLVLLLGAGLALERLTGRAEPEAHYVLDDLRDLSATELARVLGSLDTALTNDAQPPEQLELHDLTPQQLQELLRSLET